MKAGSFVPHMHYEIRADHIKDTTFPFSRLWSLHFLTRTAAELENMLFILLKGQATLLVRMRSL